MSGAEISVDKVNVDKMKNHLGQRGEISTYVGQMAFVEDLKQQIANLAVRLGQ